MSFPLPPAPELPRRYPLRGRRVGDSRTETRARLSAEVPRIPWDRFVRNVFHWNKGEHVGLVGPTGQGKTTLLTAILPFRPFVAVFATKPHDETMDKLIRSGYEKITSWPARGTVDPRDMPRRVLWPDATRIDSSELQKRVFKEAFARIYREGKWTVALDETWWFAEELNMRHEIRVFLQQGRSMGISLVAATQRSRFVPLEIYDQSTHLFLWRETDADNIRRTAAINARDSSLLREVLPNLEQFQVVYVNTRTGEMVRTRVPAP